MKPRKVRPSLPFQKSIPRELVSGLATAADLLAKKKLPEAINHLELLHTRFPRIQEPLMALVEAYQDANDTGNLLRVMVKLHELRPEDGDLALALAGMYLLTVRPALALSTFKEFLRRWPEHSDAPEVRKSIASLQEDLTPLLTDLGLLQENVDDEAAVTEALALAVLHERLQIYTEEGRLTEARRMAEQLLRQRPDFAAAQNNLSLVQLAEGDLPGALATARRVLQNRPDNYHAQANEVRLLCQLGHFEEAKAASSRLAEIRQGGPDLWLKKAEALSFLGDDAQVLAALAGAKKAGKHAESGLLYHLAAVAAMRQGNLGVARKHWRQALKLAPGLTQAQENLDDLKNPVGERQAPWAFDLWNWVPQRTLREMAECVEKATRRVHVDVAVQQAMQRFIDEHPELERIAPALLDRGGPKCRMLVLQLAQGLATPSLLQALADFALSQHGSDAMRTKAAQLARDGGLLSASVPVRLWLGGEWREILLLEFEVYEEPTASRHSEEVLDLATEAFEALQEGRYADGEAVLRRALELEPDSPDLLNNLASACEFQDRPEESERLVKEIHERFPDYLFARTNLATLAARAGKLDQARELLDPVLKQGRYHVSEFSALCQAQLALLVAEKKLDAASQWLEIWEDLVGEHPQQAYWENRLLLEQLKGIGPLFDKLKKGPRTKSKS